VAAPKRTPIQIQGAKRCLLLKRTAMPFYPLQRPCGQRTIVRPAGPRVPTLMLAKVSLHLRSKTRFRCRMPRRSRSNGHCHRPLLMSPPAATARPSPRPRRTRSQPKMRRSNPSSMPLTILSQQPFPGRPHSRPLQQLRRRPRMPPKITAWGPTRFLPMIGTRRHAMAFRRRRSRTSMLSRGLVSCNMRAKAPRGTWRSQRMQRLAQLPRATLAPRRRKRILYGRLP